MILIITSDGRRLRTYEKLTLAAWSTGQLNLWIKIDLSRVKGMADIGANTKLDMALEKEWER